MTRSLFPEFRRVTQFFTAVRLLSVYFGLASRSVFAVRDCVILESFLRFTPSHILVTREAIYERPLSTRQQTFASIAFDNLAQRSHFRRR